MTKDKFDELKDKLDTKDIDQKLWIDYNNEVYKIIDENEIYKKNLFGASILLRKYVYSVTENENVKDKRVKMNISEDQWQELIGLMERGIECNK